MSTYAISDLHGCKLEFDVMLKLIEFSEYDEMYIIGDVCDRGMESIPLLQEIMTYPNIHLIFGNHDEWLAKYTGVLIEGKRDNRTLYTAIKNSDFFIWLHGNGGTSTADQFLELSYPECYDIQKYLENRCYYKELTVHGQKFLLVHSGLGSYASPNVKPVEIPTHELIWPHIGINDNPYEDTIMIVGHMPTFFYGDEYDSRIITAQNGLIKHIDCGCVFGRALGCLRLDDMAEFYVNSTYKRVE